MIIFYHRLYSNYVALCYLVFVDILIYPRISSITSLNLLYFLRLLVRNIYLIVFNLFFAVEFGKIVASCWCFVIKIVPSERCSLVQMFLYTNILPSALHNCSFKWCSRILLKKFAPLQRWLLKAQGLFFTLTTKMILLGLGLLIYYCQNPAQYDPSGKGFRFIPVPVVSINHSLRSFKGR